MTESSSAQDRSDPAPSAPAGAGDGIWPSPDYARQVARLRAAIGETVYLTELEGGSIQLGVRVTATPFVLLGLIDFPRPDPARGIAPHLILLDDGRGVNLGRVARIARHRAFAPAPGDILYLDTEAQRHLLFNERRLTRDFMARRSALALGQSLGHSCETMPERLASPGERESEAGGRQSESG